MTALKNSSETSIFDDNDYVSQHDTAEVQRLKKLSEGQGLGDVLYTEAEDYKEMMGEMGLPVDLVKSDPVDRG